MTYRWLIAAFLLKVLAGAAYGYIHGHFFPESDTWMFHEAALEYHKTILKSPAAFFSTDFSKTEFFDFFSNDANAVWKNSGNTLVIKILTLFCFITGGNYYLNVILFNLFSFGGLYLLYKTLIRHFDTNRTLLFLVVFLLPSCLFWNSGIHKDGLITCFAGVLIYATDHLITRFSLKWLLAALVSLAFLLVLRNVVVLLIIPAIVGWWWSAHLRSRHYLPFIIIYLSCVIFFFLTTLLPPQFNLPLKLAERQHEFLTLKANTVLPLPVLTSTFRSYLQVFPYAISNTFLHPYITELKGPLHLMTFLEMILDLLILIFCLYHIRPGSRKILFNPLFIFILFFAFSSILLIGYTVPFTGAIIRYKSFYTMLIIASFVLLTDPRKVWFKLSA